MPNADTKPSAPPASFPTPGVNPPVRQPRILQGDAAAAFETARSNREPIFLKAEFYADDRGWSLMNQLQGVMSPEGQINYSVQNPGVIKAWHRHDKQTDFWICLGGHVKVGVYREDDDSRWAMVIGEKCPGVMIIPPPLWHGAATVGPAPAGLFYYVTHAYNSARPDEHRRAFDSVPAFPWLPQHR